MSDGPTPIPQVIGDNLRRARNARGWTVRDLADRLRDIGAPMSLAAISQSERPAETGRRITVEDALRFALVFNTPLIDLLAPEAGSLDIAPDVPPIPNHAVEAWISGKDPWPPEADREAFYQFADQHRRVVDAAWNRPEMIALGVLTGLVREAIRGETQDEMDLAETDHDTDPAERAKLLRERAKQHAKLLRREARRVMKYVDLLADSLGDDDGR